MRERAENKSVAWFYTFADQLIRDARRNKKKLYEAAKLFTQYVQEADLNDGLIETITSLFLKIDEIAMIPPKVARALTEQLANFNAWAMNNESLPPERRKEEK